MADNERPAPARRGLADILDETPLTPPDRIPPELVRAVAAGSGHRGQGEQGARRAAAFAPEPDSDVADVAFIKPKTDRKHTINVRVNREARAFVAQEAMRRGVAIAEVIEDAIAALKAEREAGR